MISNYKFYNNYLKYSIMSHYTKLLGLNEVDNYMKSQTTEMHPSL